MFVFGVSFVPGILPIAAFGALERLPILQFTTVAALERLVTAFGALGNLPILQITTFAVLESYEDCKLQHLELLKDYQYCKLEHLRLLKGCEYCKLHPEG